MDNIISDALEEVCVRGASGIRLLELWPTLQASVSSSNLELSDCVKKVIWGRLASHPGLGFMVSGSSMERKDVLQGSMEEMEKIGLTIVAEEHLRDSFMGLYDLKQSPHCEISQIQKRVLERLAMARTTGVTQNELAKELDIKGTNFYYVVRNLVCQQLIVKQSTMVREKESAHAENGPKNDQIVNTNLLHLSRYAKNVNLNPQQRIEITRSVWPPMLNESGDTELCTVPIEGSEDCLREDVHIKDFIPAMKAICDKLEATKNKVHVVSSIKLALGYRKTTGHRAWRSILFRLKCAGFVEEFRAAVNGKDVSCLRLLKEFDPKYFLPKAFMHRYRCSNSENLVRSGKRGQITDQLVEVPLDHQIYDMIDAEGQRGITILELSRRLGINSKKLHKRVMSVREKFGVVARSEIHNKQQVYRFWTHGSHLQNPIKSFTDDQNMLSDEHDLSNQASDSVPFDRPLVSKSEHELLVGEERNKGQELKIRSSCGPISEVIESEQEPDDRANKDNFMEGNVNLDEASCTPDSGVSTSTSLQAISVSSIPILQTQKYACRSSSLFSALREQRILEKLEDEKFLLKVELHKWLEDIEKDKPTTMDRKTLDRSLKKLQDAGFCRCIGVHMPSLTNFNSLRYTEAILHPSVNPSQELMQKIYEKQRSFDVRSRRSGFGRIKVERPVVELPQLKDVERASTHADGSKAMINNGFVLAKMVRVKLLHKFLWSYLSSLPYWQNAFKLSRKGSVNVTNPAEDCQLFSLDAAIKEMPLELFLQVAGSKLVIDNLERKCKLGLKLSDLSVQERRCLLDSQATSRLSSIVEILYRLRLIQLVNKGAVQDVNLLSHALELQPYLEEPMPAVLPSSDINRSDNCYKLRHDFILSDNEVVDRYWETLEYCFAVADPSYSRQCFPGSHVEEVFHRRSWSSVRVMTTEQRLKLLKYVKTDDQTNKISFSKCVKTSRELNLTLEQVLRVCYDNRQTRLAKHFNHLKYEGREQNDDANIIRPVPRKMRRLSNHTLRDQTQNVPPGELNISDEKTSFKFDEEVMHLDSCSPPAAVNVRTVQACRDEELSPTEVQLQPCEEAETAALITKCAFNELKPSRKRKFSWTDNSDRKLVMQYARHRAMLGARFSRVDWPTLCDLPAQPNTCKRRMTTLNKNSNIRRAVLRLCNLLGERYTHYLDNSRNKPDQKSTDIDNFEKIDESFMLCDTVHNDSVSCVNICKSNFQHDGWDNFEDFEVRMALDEVLKYRRLAKKEDARSVGGRPDGGWTHNPLSDNLNFTSHGPKKCSASSCAGGVLHDSDKKDPAKVVVSSATDQNKLNNYSSRGKFLKFRGKGNLSQIYKSLSIANAIELLKLVFLSFSKTPGVQNLLARTLQKYPQRDIFAAFNYLREKNYLVVGHGSRPFVLSRKFFQDLSSSPFSNDSGKRATNFSNWLQIQKNDLIQDGVTIPPDLQCGEIAHLFSLVLFGEILVSPCLPNCGIGEADELKTPESFSSWGEVGDIGASQNLKHKADASYRSEKVERSKLASNADGDRREKGFPGIKVMLKMESVMTVDDFECLGYEKDSIHTLTGDSTSVEETCLTSSSDNEDVIHEIDSPKCWDGMSRYVEYLASTSGIANEGMPSSRDFKFIHSIIRGAGEQGLSMDEISEALKIKGEMVAEMVADTLGVFRLAAKVNAFDSIRVVDASHASKYFIRVPNHGKIHKHVNDILSCTKPQETCSGTPGGPFQEHHDKVDKSKANACSRNDKSLHVQDNVVGSVRNPVGGMEGGFQPILPWISGDGNINFNVYKGLTRRVLGIVMQNPCILEEDIIAKMDVLNPQSCRRLLEIMVLDNHVTVRRMHQTATPAPPPTILQSLFPSNFKRPTLKLRNHYFANPMSTRML
ncbi:uncharacterized protein LOC110032283 isoform X2 [Phalaenopsis equestris]|uniref:uncharacterized protein LOC110032283 isoform X2 n=1 Tax=Phalaenopsis equestris TaxID=78828 RepID=UPI0009E294F1|nr:uncharacterized protein LOC110032283 isoform X2 [Phalaenopsis equestris]